MFRVTAPLILALLIHAAPASAQAASDRAALAALDDTLGRMEKADQLRQLRGDATGERSDPAGKALSNLRLSLILLREGELSAGRQTLDAAEAAADEAVFRAPDDWPWPWYALARIKFALAERGVTAKSSMHQPAGDSYRSAGFRALTRSLAADSTFTRAAGLLAEVLLPMGERELTDELQAAVRRAAHADAGAEPLLALGRMYRNLTRPDSALAAFQTYISAGGDSGVGLLEEARALHGLERSGNAVRAYLTGAAVQSPRGREAFRLDLGWIASPAELAAFDSLPPEQAGKWIEAFWANRDATQLRAPGERLLEHLRRWRYVHENFRVTGRQDGASFTASGTDCGAAGLASLDTESRELQLYLPGLLPATKGGRRLIDDRGLIYMRHGEPDARVSAAGAPTGNPDNLTSSNAPVPPNATWKYVTPTGGLLFHFCSSRGLGSQAATTLVAMLPLSIEMIEPRGALDLRFERLAGNLYTKRGDDYRKRKFGARAASKSRDLVGATLVQQLERVGKENLRAGLSSDSYRPRFPVQIEPLAQFFVLGNRQDRRGTVLVVFALPGGNLAPTPLAQGGVAYPVALRLIATNARGEVSRIDTVRTFRTADTLRAGQYLTGLAELPLPSGGTWDIRTIFTQPGTEAGGAVGRLGAELPPASGLGLSDLVFGRKGSGLAWQHRGTTIPLNPLDAYPRGGTVEVYYELNGLSAGVRYETTLRIEAIVGESEGDVEVSFSETARAGFEGVQRSVELDDLEGGQYRLSITVTDPANGSHATRDRLINVVGR